MTKEENIYTCPMHPEVRQPKPGKCPICKMDLVLEGGTEKAHAVSAKWKVKDFLPLIIIFAVIFILTGIAVGLLGRWDTMFAMRYFEGFFFLIFGGFKLLNWKGFVDAYSTYDIIAKRSRFYGWLYPLIEISLAIGFLFAIQLMSVLWITLILMIIGSIGVFKEIRKKNQIPCACLGVVFKIPMTWVTFIEDILMAVMAVIMIIISIWF